MPTTCKLIAKTTLGSSAANIEFTSIPGTYTDLWCVYSLRTDEAFTEDVLKVEFNGSSSNLSSRTLSGNGSSAISLTNTYLRVGLAVAANATADTFGSGEFYVPNYAGSTAKSVSVTAVAENNSSTAYIQAIAGLWNDTAAITSLKFLPLSTDNFVSGSSVYLYGITKA